jgi:hypothetical protein
MSSSGTESDSSTSSDVDFDDYGEFGYQLEPEYMEEELIQMEEAASAQRREIENIICLDLLKNKIFKIKIWSLTSENT